MRRLLSMAAALLMLLMPLCALGEGRVYYASETEPFDEGAELLTVRVAPLEGGDCMLLTLGDRSMIVDWGKVQHTSAIRALLAEAGLDHVDVFFNSHPHCDHIDGFIRMVGEGFPVGEFITFFPLTYKGGSVSQKGAVRAAEKAGIPIVEMNTGDRVPFGDAELTAYRVPDDRITKQMTCNDLSAMLMIRYGECSILLTGDCDIRAQQVLEELYDLDADILKFPHHGMGTVHIGFLPEVDPEFAFITHGSINTKKAQNTLRKYGCTRFSFATWGVITMQTDGKKWIVSQEYDPAKDKFITKYLREHKWIRVPR